jgi:hypothetical protein
VQVARHTVVLHTPELGRGVTASCNRGAVQVEGLMRARVLLHEKATVCRRFHFDHPCGPLTLPQSGEMTMYELNFRVDRSGR